MIFDSRQIWQGTSAGPKCWIKLNTTPIDNAIIRQFYNDDVMKLKEFLSGSVTQVYTDVDQDQFIDDDEEDETPPAKQIYTDPHQE